MTGAEQGEEGEDDECYGARVHDVAEADKWCDYGADYISRQTEQGRRLARTAAPLAHGEGVCCGEDQSEPEEHHPHAYLENPQAMYSPQGIRLCCGAYGKDDGSCAGCTLEGVEPHGQHGACRHKDGIEADDKTISGLAEAIMILKDKGGRREIGEQDAKGKSFITDVDDERPVAQQRAVAAQ